MEAPKYPASVLSLASRFGEAMRLARAERGWTQAEMAERLRVSSTTIKKIESGAVGTAFGTIIEACDLLGMSPDPAAGRNADMRQHALKYAPKRVRRKLSRPELDV